MRMHESLCHLYTQVRVSKPDTILLGSGSDRKNAEITMVFFLHLLPVGTLLYS
jgi:hypothetical protein